MSLEDQSFGTLIQRAHYHGSFSGKENKDPSQAQGPFKVFILVLSQTVKKI